MDRTAIESKMFRSYSYDPVKEILELEFANGNVYRYKGVTPKDWDNFRTAESKGRHFGAYIRGKFETYRVEEKHQHESDEEETKTG